jgi:ferredoxin
MSPHKESHQRKTAFIRLDSRRCDACWECIAVCPKQVLGKIDVFWHRHVTIRQAEACNGCRKCVRACESGAIEYTYVPESQAARNMDERQASGSGKGV